eukprot:1157282-Pelagomonas_calceolata.AAC.10
MFFQIIRLKHPAGHCPAGRGCAQGPVHLLGCDWSYKPVYFLGCDRLYKPAFPPECDRLHNQRML